jgi:phytoene dehydrogenase-like protein
MSTRSDPQLDSYDVIVIGAGLAGLSSAGLLARSDLKVLLVDRQDGPGGYAKGFRRGPYTFDPAVHWTAQGGPNQLYESTLRYLGVDHLCRFLLIDSAYGANFPDGSYHLPLGYEEFVEAHVQAFPNEAAGLRQYWHTALRMHEDIHKLSMRLSLRTLDQAVEQYPILFKYRTATLQDVLDEYLTDPRAKAVCAATWPYQGAPPSRLAFFGYAQNIMNMLEGSYFCQGSFDSLATALGIAVTQNGGDLLLETEVTRILVEDGKAVGIRTAKGQEIRAPVVISNADALQTFDELIGP